MKEKDITFRREELEKLSTLELDCILRTELDSDTPERENILLLLSILEDRDPTDPQNRPEGAADAWNEFVNRNGNSQTAEQPARKSRKWFVPVAAAAAVALILLLTVPQTVGAESIFEILGRWTRDLFCLSDIEGTSSNDEYIFQTDHEGLQQVYDAVVDQGVTDPVVPTWIPEGYKLKELHVVPSHNNSKVYARFENGDYYIQFVVDINEAEKYDQHPKNVDDAKVYCSLGVDYYIISNEDVWKAIWKCGIAECSITINDTEPILRQMLYSIQGRVLK